MMSVGYKPDFRLQGKVVAPGGCLTANQTSDFKDSVCFTKAYTFLEHLHFSAALCLSFPAGDNGPELLLKVL